MAYKVVLLGKNKDNCNCTNIEETFSTIEDAIHFIKTTLFLSNIDYSEPYAEFILDSNDEVVAVHTCLGWKYDTRLS